MTEKKFQSAAPILSPSSQTVAAAVHFYAKQHEWNLSFADLVELTGYKGPKIRAVCAQKGWLGRLRTSKTEHGMRQAKSKLSVDPETVSPLRFE